MIINSTPSVINETDVKEIHVNDTGCNTSKSSGPSQVRFLAFISDSNLLDFKVLVCLWDL
jgi:hypothetical protein